MQFGEKKKVFKVFFAGDPQLYITSHQLIIFAKKNLVGGFNLFEKYARQFGSFPKVGVKIENV